MSIEGILFFMKGFIKTLFMFVLLGALGYIFRAPIEDKLADIWSLYAPCKRPLAYSLGSFDGRFGLSRQ